MPANSICIWSPGRAVRRQRIRHGLRSICIRPADHPSRIKIITFLIHNAHSWGDVPLRDCCSYSEERVAVAATVLQLEEILFVNIVSAAESMKLGRFY